MKKLFLVVALAGTVMAPSVVRAQTIVGPAVAYHDGAEAIGIGGYASIPVPQIHENLVFNTNFIYFFPDGFDYWEINGDAIYRFPVSDSGAVMPFALAGINIGRTSVSFGGASASSTDIGLNLGGGVVFPNVDFRPVVGGKFELQDGSTFVLFGGIGFPVG